MWKKEEIESISCQRREQMEITRRQFSTSEKDGLSNNYSCSVINLTSTPSGRLSVIGGFIAAAKRPSNLDGES